MPDYAKINCCLQKVKPSILNLFLIFVFTVDFNSLLISESFGPAPNTFSSDDSCLLVSNFIVYDGKKQNQSANYKKIY